MLRRSLLRFTVSKSPPFSPSKSILEVLKATTRTFKGVGSEPVPIEDVLKDKFKSDQWSKELVAKAIENTQHWASLSADDKKSLALPKPVVMALDTSPEVQQQMLVVQQQLLVVQQQVQQQLYEKVLLQFGISTVSQWQELSKESKKKIEKEGLPEAVINDLNKAVRVGLLMPEFKYAEEVASIREKFYHIDEVKSLVQYATDVDSCWLLNRQDCDTLCQAYQQMAEWTMKFLLEKWTSGVSDDEFFANPKLHCVQISRHVGNKGTMVKHSFWVRYPIKHNLHTLLTAVQKQTTFQGPPCELASLKKIQSCARDTTGGREAKGDRISCKEFFDHATEVDKLLFSMWNFMNSEMTSPNSLQK